MPKALVRSQQACNPRIKLWRGDRLRQRAPFGADQDDGVGRWDETDCLDDTGRDDLRVIRAPVEHARLLQPLGVDSV